MREFSVLIRAAKDLPECWVAHCLNWDLVSQGSSPSDAAKSVAEAIVLAIEEDTAAGVDPDDRPAAPTEDWEIFQRTLQSAMRVAAADVDRLPGRGAIVAAVMYFAQAGARSGKADSSLPAVPPPFMIAAMPHDNSSARPS